MWNITNSSYCLNCKPFSHRKLFNELRWITAPKKPVFINWIQWSVRIGTTAHVQIKHILFSLVNHNVLHASIEMHHIHCILCSFLWLTNVLFIFFVFLLKELDTLEETSSRYAKYRASHWSDTWLWVFGFSVLDYCCSLVISGVSLVYS